MVKTVKMVVEMLPEENTGWEAFCKIDIAIRHLPAQI